jgi:hypothetical protein
MHEGLLVITAVQVDPARGSTGALKVRGDLHSWAMGTVKKVYKSNCLFSVDMDGGIPILSHLGWLRVGQEIASSAFRSHQKVALGRSHLQLFHWLFLDLLLCGSYLKGREFKEVWK